MRSFRNSCCLIVVPAFLAGLLSVQSISGLEPTAYLEWYGNHQADVTRTQTTGDVNYSMLFVPKELELIRFSKKKRLSKEAFQQFERDHKGTMSFLFEIEVPALGSKEFILYPSKAVTSYEDKLNYFAFGFQHDIKLVADHGDTIPCSDYFFERNFSISPKGKISLSFPVPAHCQTLEICVNNKAFGHSGLLFTYTTKELNHLPTLKNPTKWKTSL